MNNNGNDNDDGVIKFPKKEMSYDPNRILAAKRFNEQELDSLLRAFVGELLYIIAGGGKPERLWDNFRRVGSAFTGSDRLSGAKLKAILTGHLHDQPPKHWKDEVLLEHFFAICLDLATDPVAPPQVGACAEKFNALILDKTPGAEVWRVGAVDVFVIVMLIPSVCKFSGRMLRRY
jgi:hypothetical protein